jgi:hypothetical protein
MGRMKQAIKPFWIAIALAALFILVAPLMILIGEQPPLSAWIGLVISLLGLGAVAYRLLPPYGGNT